MIRCSRTYLHWSRLPVILSDDGFKVFPYTTDDLIVAERLLEAGCEVLMPWCAPIGSALGPLNLHALRSLRGTFS